MEVILIQDVDRVGKRGAVIKVKDGFARNFLFPNKLACLKSASNEKKLGEEKKQVEQQEEKRKREAEQLGQRLSGLSLTISALAKDEDKLYGSIGREDIARALKEEGFEFDKDYILLDEPIKALGIYDLAVKLHPEISTKIKLWVVKK